MLEEFSFDAHEIEARLTRDLHAQDCGNETYCNTG
jgi:hypothetical protein